MNATLEVLATGPLATVQDLGRQGLARWGVSWSGAADRGSLRLANRLVGNREDAAGLEVTFGGVRLRCHGDAVVAVTGAPCQLSLDGRAEGMNTTIALRAGQELELSTPTSGVRSYLAVRGGFDVPPVLGSRATDVLAELGPEVLSPGRRLPVGASPSTLLGLELAPVPEPAAGEVTLRVSMGPRADWFTDEARATLLHAAWTAAPDSNRIGLRLSGPELVRATSGELPSEGMVRGALQVPPTGSPTIFLADHPVTGGYPVIAVVLDADVDRVAQIRPGQVVRLRAIEPT